MTSLPSFCELMDSLGLSDDKTAGPGVSARIHSRTSSSVSVSSTSSSPRPSISITLSRPTSRASLNGRGSVSRGTAARFAPYDLLNDRRGSMPALPHRAQDERPTRLRSNSTSPPPSGVTRTVRKPALRLDASPSRRDRLSFTDADLSVNTPISSLARHKSPVNSPVVASFAESVSAAGAQLLAAPLTPVCVPTLPSLFPSASTPYAFPAATRVDDGNVDVDQSLGPRDPVPRAARRSPGPGPAGYRGPVGLRLSASQRFEKYQRQHRVSASIA